MEFREWMASGSVATRGGYILQAKDLLGIDAKEVESRFGFRKGRFAEGWYWLVLVERPSAKEFSVMGSTLYPEGEPEPGGPNFDDLAKLKVTDYARTKEGMADFWPLRGPYRFMKAVPAIPHTPAEDYPPGMGKAALQIKLLVPKKFRVVRRVGPNETLSEAAPEWRAALELQA